MFDNRKTIILEKGEYKNEFETKAPNYFSEPSDVSELADIPETISSNFDKIIHWSDYANPVNDVQTNKVEYNNYVGGIKDGASPSTTTMQFTKMTKAEQYQDYKQEEDIDVRAKKRSKAVIITLIVVGIVVGLMTVFNALLLSKMDKIIQEKTQTINTLVEKTEQIDSEIEYAKSEENIYQKLVEKGLV